MEVRLVKALQGVFGTPPTAIVPNGDDAVVVPTSAATAITVDTQQEGIHFQWAWASPARLGERFVGVVLSDLAAMGAKPSWGVLSLVLPPGMSLARVVHYARGMQQRAQREHFHIVGGDVTRGAAFGAALTAFGEAPLRPLRRDTVRPGDVLCVSGPIGQAASELRQRQVGERTSMKRWLNPPSRLALGQELAGDSHVSGGMDISDGLFLDARRMAEASGVGLALDLDLIPLEPGLRRRLRSCPFDERLSILGGGEDYELLIALDPNYTLSGLTPIGQFTRSGFSVLSAGRKRRWPATGYLHA
jgi:thiamine-monophosphate kinase